MIRSPCGRQCPERYVRIDENGKATTCHSTCKEWKEYEKLKAEERKARAIESMITEYKNKSQDRMRRLTHYYTDRK